MPSNKASFASLSHRPQGFAHASSLAGSLLDGSQVRRIEDGPYGGTPLMVGEEQAGETITAPHSAYGQSWGAVRIVDYSLAQTAHALSLSNLSLPGLSKTSRVQIDVLEAVGRMGVYHIDINGPLPRGLSARFLLALLQPILACGTTTLKRRAG